MILRGRVLKRSYGLSLVRFSNFSNSSSMDFNTSMAALMSEVAKISIETKLPKFLIFRPVGASGFARVVFQKKGVYRSDKSLRGDHLMFSAFDIVLFQSMSGCGNQDLTCWR